MQKIKKPVSILLSLIMALSLFTIVPFTAGAVDEVYYIDESGIPQIPYSVIEVTGDTTFRSRVYAVTSNINYSDRITCSGDVRLILCDGAKLTLEKGIEVNEGSSITIYGQNSGTGTLEITGTGNLANAALGSNYDCNSGTITINGGTVTASATAYDSSGAAIGGGSNGKGNVIINGGTVTASARNGAAIGGGSSVHNGTGSGNVIINGGTITATSNNPGSGSAAIGGGARGSGNVTINGGDIYAVSNGYGAAIGSGASNRDRNTVTINGGNITATSNGSCAAIGSGAGNMDRNTVTINGGNITATSNGSCAAIGDGYESTGSDIHLSWTNKTDSITADSYSGTVTLEKVFYNGAKVLSKGIVSDIGVISGKTLSPYQGFAGHSISLNGDIGLNFFLAGIAEGTNLHFEWYNKTFDHTVTAADYDAVSGCYKVKVNVAAAEMNYPITATCTYNGTVLATDTYSVRQYADKILDSTSDFSTDYVANNGAEKYGLLVDLIKKMLDYGAKAQSRFGVTDVELANNGVDYTMQPITADDIVTKKTDMTKGLSKLGLTYVGTSVVFLSQTTLRHYYAVTNQNVFDSVKASANFTYGEKGTRIYFERADIPAALLDSAQTFGIGESEYNYSVLDYCKLVIADESKSQSDRELAMATYWYNNAAKAYFYANDEYEDDMV